MICARLVQAQHTVLHGTTGFCHAHSAFRGVFRRVEAHRDLIDSSHATREVSPHQGLSGVPPGLGVSVQLERECSAACEQLARPVVIHRYQVPGDVLIDCDVEAVLSDLPFGQPDIGFAWTIARRDVLKIGRASCRERVF